MYDRVTYKEIQPIYVKDGWQYENTGFWRESLFKDSKGYRLLCVGDFNSKYARQINGPYAGYQAGCFTENLTEIEAFAWATSEYESMEDKQRHWNEILSGKYDKR